MILHYKESGNPDAPLIVFLHGGGVSGWMWDKQVQYFSNHYHCIAPDLPDHGLSKAIPYSIEKSADQVIDLIHKKAQGKKVIITGFSLGAQVAIKLLSMAPHLVDYAVINSALVRPMSFARGVIKPTVKLTMSLAKKRWFAKWQAKQLYIGDDDFETYFAESSQIAPEAMVRVLEENMSFALPKDFSISNAKILVTVGKKEKGIMLKSAYDIVKSHPTSKGIIIPNVGHGLPLFDPNLFNQIINAWVSEEELPIGLQWIK